MKMYRFKIVEVVERMVVVEVAARSEGEAREKAECGDTVTERTVKVNGVRERVVLDEVE